jgi:isopentenyl-diphosphate delta-isomerase
LDAKRIKEIMSRKEEHISICLGRQVSFTNSGTLFDCVRLLNEALPEMNLDDIDTSTTFLGHKFSAPLMAGAMTGGAELASKINSNIAEAVEELGLGMVLGSQRAGLYDKALADTYSIARKRAPTAFIGSNVGGAQLSGGLGVEESRKLLKMLDADALYVHLNPLQEIVQPEGEPSYRGVASRITEIARAIDKPIVAKEVGSGISGRTAKRLEAAGVKAIEVAGSGGVSYSAVEYYRAAEQKMQAKEAVGKLFWNWGIPTAAAVRMASGAVKIPVVASGGIRNGQEMAKSIALGASMCATALPLLKPATVSSQKVKETMEQMIYELKVTMFLTGCRNMKDLGKAPFAITGELKEYLDTMKNG